MAGSYPDPPGQKVPYHLDGTIGVYEMYSSNAWTAMTQAQVNRLNSENASKGGTNASNLADLRHMALVFPRPLDLTGVFVTTGNDYNSILTSADTTNGVDGTWTAASPAIAPGVYQNLVSMRNDIRSVSLANVKGIRVRAGTSGNYHWVDSLHLYVSGVTDVLRLWHPTLDQALDPIDFGNVLQGATTDTMFRVKNDSAQSATGVVVSFAAQEDATPSFVDDVTFDAGSGFATTVNIGDLAAGATSAVVTMRQVLDPTAELGPQFGYISMTPS